MYNVFNTEEEANTAQQNDFNLWKATKPQQPEKYWATTTAWAVPQQRLDGKWVYSVCPEGVQTHQQEAYQEDWFDQI
jgi:hypothetical protein